MRKSDVVETQRLILRPFTREDIAMFLSDVSEFEDTSHIILYDEWDDYLSTGYLCGLKKRLL